MAFVLVHKKGLIEGLECFLMFFWIYFVYPKGRKVEEGEWEEAKYGSR